MKLDDPADRTPDADAIAKIADNMIGDAPTTPNLLDDTLQLPLGTGGKYHPGPFPGEEPSGGGTDATPGPGDEGDFAGEQSGTGFRGCHVLHTEEPAPPRAPHPGPTSTWLTSSVPGTLTR